MDDENKGVNERWGQPGHIPERGYATDDADAQQRTAEIRSDIDRTRADMTETIDAIQDKLRPSNIVSNAGASVRDATVGRMKEAARSARETFRGEGRRDYGGQSYGVVDRVRSNPLPAAIAAASIAWIAFSGRRTRPRMGPAIYGSTRHGEPFIRETTIDESGDVDVSRSVGASYESTGFGQRSESMMRATGERVRRASSTAGTNLQRMMRENPLALGAVAAAVGATIGAALPSTRRENELMGDARDTVVERAQDAARDTAQRVKDAARQVQDVAGEAVKTVTGEKKPGATRE